MNFIENILSIISPTGILIVPIYALINIHISKYHLKVMDKIVYGRQIPDYYIFKIMRTIEYMWFFIRKLFRERLSIKTQKEIMALDKKFRRPFMMLWWLYIVMMIIVILEVFFPTPNS